MGNSESKTATAAPPLPPTTVQELLAINVPGAILAATSGAIIFMGYGAAFYPKSTKEELIRRAQGGCILMLGLYLWAPASMRRAWM